ncbi:hypothetical protein GALL_217540 [mine drainage metagenome]|uniref:FecR protein domain-containing protein n=1 Tax=mine drainage metagenome TaxID=410659 RepID=A0A1J5S7H1_9ZZZZ
MNEKVQRGRRALLYRAAGLAGFIGMGDIFDSRRALAAGTTPAQGIRRLSGSVTVNGAPAAKGTPVLAGDTVVTGAASEAIYVFGRDAFLQRADSRIRLGSGAARLLRVISGDLLSVFGKGNIRIETPTATIGIRGTGCYIEAQPKRVYFCLCYGVAELIPSAAPNERELIRSKHHDHPMYIYDDPRMPTMMVPAGVINHFDAELVMLESLVGRRPPFASD